MIYQEFDDNSPIRLMNSLIHEESNDNSQLVDLSNFVFFFFQMDVQKKKQTFIYVHASRVPPPGMQTTTYCCINNLFVVCESFVKYSVLEDFIRGPLGHFMQIPHSSQVTTPQLILQVLLREVKFPSAHPDEMWFELGGVACRYGKQEFTLMTGLRFGPIDGEILQARPAKDGGLRAHLFPHKEVVYVEDIKELLDTKPNLDKDDALKNGIPCQGQHAINGP